MEPLLQSPLTKRGWTNLEQPSSFQWSPDPRQSAEQALGASPDVNPSSAASSLAPLLLCTFCELLNLSQMLPYQKHPAAGASINPFYGGEGEINSKFLEDVMSFLF